VYGLSSQSVSITNNVIANLRIVPRTVRGDQTDGVHFAGVRTATRSSVEDNVICGVDEGIDIFGADISVVRNHIAGRSLAIKVIHGASGIHIEDNDMWAGRIAAVGIYRGSRSDRSDVVKGVLITGNRISSGAGRAILIDEGETAPLGVVVASNSLAHGGDKGTPPRCIGQRCRENKHLLPAEQAAGACP
jgi:hypothetical protein